MVARVRLGGKLLDLSGAVFDLVDSTIWRSGDYSGCFQASCTFVPTVGRGGRRLDRPWLRRGAPFEIFEQGKRTWAGRLQEFTPNDAGAWLLAAAGMGRVLADYPAFEVDGSPPTGADPVKASVDPNAAVDYAHNVLSMPVTRGSHSLNFGQLGAPPDSPRMLNELLVVAAANGGRRLRVDENSILSMVPDPTTPTWTVTPGVQPVGTLDENYVTHLVAKFLDNSSTPVGLPAWKRATENATKGSVMAARYGAVWRIVDLTGLGNISGADALGNLSGRYTLLGARMGWVDPVTLTPGMIRRIGAGPASPLNVRAGQMLRIPGVIDTRSAVVKGSIDFVIGELVRNHTTGTAVATPVGFPDRDFDGALAPAQAAELDALLTT